MGARRFLPACPSCAPWRARRAAGSSPVAAHRGRASPPFCRLFRRPGGRASAPPDVVTALPFRPAPALVWGWRVEGGGCVASPAPPPTPSPTAAAAAEGGGCVGDDGLILWGDAAAPVARGSVAPAARLSREASYSCSPEVRLRSPQCAPLLLLVCLQLQPLPPLSFPISPASSSSLALSCFFFAFCADYTPLWLWGQTPGQQVHEERTPEEMAEGHAAEQWKDAEPSGVCHGQEEDADANHDDQCEQHEQEGAGLVEGGRPRTCSRSGTKYGRGRAAPPEPAGTPPAPPASAPTPVAPPAPPAPPATPVAPTPARPGAPALAAPPTPAPPGAPAPARPPKAPAAPAAPGPAPPVAPGPVVPPAPAPPAAPAPAAPPGPAAPVPPVRAPPGPVAPEPTAPPAAVGPPAPVAPPAPAARLQR
ncbi:unnamed protein product [Closterium sp. NIES-53]